MKEPSFTVGIEEEYLLVDADTRGLIHEAPPTMFAECEALLEGQVAPEFLQCQIEVGTRVCSSIGEARADLQRLRSTVASVARSHGLRLVAASTHPFAVWGEQMRTQKERYQTIEQDLQEVVRRLVICGMHVHVGVDDDELRIDLMNQVSYVLPHLLALGTSSRSGRDTTPGSSPTGSRCGTRCRAPGSRSGSRATGSSSASSTCSCAPA